MSRDSLPLALALNWRQGQRRAGIAIVALVLMAFSAVSVAQTSPEAPPPATTHSADQASPAQRSAAPEGQLPQRTGLFDSISGWFRSATPDLSSRLRGAGEAIGNAGNTASDFAKGAAKAIPGLSAAGTVSGRALCPVAPNGAPDCTKAATQLCIEKGYKSGRSVDFMSADKCSASVYLSGRQNEPGACKTETFVTRAVCQ